MVDAQQIIELFGMQPLSDEEGGSMLRRIGLVNGLRGRDCPGRGGFCPDGLYRVSPGFEFADYQRADRDQLIRLYPDMDDLIIRLT